MPVAQDPFQQIVNVQWGEGLQFLYSGADGMFGSQDGQDWKKAETSEPAASLAFVDDVWIGAGPGGCWRSDDGAKTWQSVGAPAFNQVAAMKPKGVGPDGEPRQGVFAGWIEDESGDNNIVYSSHDLGKTWGVALVIPTDGGADDGFERINGLSGCGGAFFVCTNYKRETFHAGDGKIYSSRDGYNFSAATAFGPGSTILPGDPDQFPRKSFGARAVGYDPKTKTYIAIGDKEIIPALGTQESYLVYTISNAPSFGESEGAVAASATQSTSGEFILVGNSAAGGDGKHVAGLSRIHYGIGGAYVSGDLQACFIPGSPETVLSMGASAGGFIGSFCFKPDVEEEETDGETTSGAGAFACVAFGVDGNGGVYIDSGTSGHFTRTHGGQGISDGGAIRGAVAVGTVGFL